MHVLCMHVYNVYMGHYCHFHGVYRLCKLLVRTAPRPSRTYDASLKLAYVLAWSTQSHTHGHYYDGPPGELIAFRNHIAFSRQPRLMCANISISAHHLTETTWRASVMGALWGARSTVSRWPINSNLS